MATVSIKKIADFYGVNIETVYEWLKKEIITPVEDTLSPSQKRFNLEEVVRSVYRYQLRMIMTRGECLSEEKKRLTKIKADLADLKFRKEQGELIEKKKVEKEAFELARQIRNNLESIPSRVSALLAAESDEKKVKEILINEIYQALEALRK